jgi:hypothetical protein
MKPLKTPWKRETNMNSEEKIEFCFLKEINSVKNISHKAIQESELRPQELHIQLKEGRFSVLRQHENQDHLRNSFLLNLFKAAQLKNSGLNFEFIFNSGDDVDFYEEGVPRWCFTRRSHHPNLLIPNPHVGNIHNITKSFTNTDLEFEDKKDKAIFAGSYTGGFLPEDNQRFLFCLKNKDHDLGKFVISNFCVDKKVLQDYDWKSLGSDFISYDEQLKYKYILNINGNTNCWDRLLWAMNSNSLCLFLRPKREDMCWHYHYFKTFGGFVYADETDWEASVRFFNQNPSVAKKLSGFQKEQSDTFVKTENHVAYFKKIVSFYNKVYNSSE